MAGRSYLNMWIANTITAPTVVVTITSISLIGRSFFMN